MATFIKKIHRDMTSVEPFIVRTNNGELLCICTCGDIMEPAPGNRVYFWHSNDEGRTWSKKMLLGSEEGIATYAVEVFCIKDRILCYIAEHSGYFTNWKCVVYESCDNGYNWKKLGDCPQVPDYTFIRSAIILKNGNILLPYQHYPVTPEENNRLFTEGKYGWSADIDHVESGVLISKDGGLSFEKGGFVSTDIGGGRLPVRWQWTEPTIVELSNATIVMLLRYNGTGYLWKSESLDGGITWSEPEQTCIPNPDNKPLLFRLDEKRIALLNTPTSNCGLDNRYPLSVWISDDDLQTWKYKKNVCDFDGAYSYPSAIMSNDKKRLLITVDFNRSDVYFFDFEI